MHAGTKKWGCGCTRKHVYSHGLSHADADVCTSCRYTGSIGLFLCRNNLFLDHRGLFLLAGLQPLSAAHRRELLWGIQSGCSLIHYGSFLSAFFLVKNRAGGGDFFNILNVRHISLITSLLQTSRPEVFPHPHRLPTEGSRLGTSRPCSQVSASPPPVWVISVPLCLLLPPLQKHGSQHQYTSCLYIMWCGGEEGVACG